MALTDAQYKQLVILQTGDTADLALTTNIDLLWELHTDKAALPELRFRYVKREAIGVVLGKLREQVSFTGPGQLSMSLHQRIDTLIAMDGLLRAEIVRLEAAGVGHAPAAAQLITPAPVVPPGGSGVDANDRAYRGDPYRRTRSGR